jgi:hypothetical protein
MLPAMCMTRQWKVLIHVAANSAAFELTRFPAEFVEFLEGGDEENDANLPDACISSVFPLHHGQRGCDVSFFLQVASFGVPRRDEEPIRELGRHPGRYGLPRWEYGAIRGSCASLADAYEPGVSFTEFMV